MSNMEKIIAKISETCGVNKGGIALNSGSSTGENEFFKYYKENKIPFTAKEIINIISQMELDLDEGRTARGCTGRIQGDLIKNTSIACDRLKAKYNLDEVLWERLIVRANEYLFNQLCVGASIKESVDLIYSEDKNRKRREKFIELKVNTETDNPLFAFVELLKNYYLTKKTTENKNKEHKDIKELIFLAPKFYYQHFLFEERFTGNDEKTNFIEQFCYLIKEFNQQNNEGLVFNMYYLDVDKEEMTGFTDNLKKDYQNKGIAENENVFKKDCNIEDKLKFKNWKEIKTIEDWLKLLHCSEEDIKNKIEEAKNGGADKIYASDVVNYQGAFKESKTFYTEFVIKYLVENGVIVDNDDLKDYEKKVRDGINPQTGETLTKKDYPTKKLNIDKSKMITREENKQPYYTKNHRNFTVSPVTNQTDKNFVKSLFFYNPYEYISKPIDYEIPIRNSDKQNIGEIDLITYDEENNILYFVEAKKPKSDESLLRACLEIQTYYQTVNRERLIEDFREAKEHTGTGIKDDVIIKKAVLIFENSEPAREYVEMLMGKRPYLEKLIEYLNIKVWII